MTSRLALAVLAIGFAAPSPTAQVPAGGEFQVNAGSYNTMYPSLASNGSGKFVVVWMSSSEDTDLFARRFDATGTPRGDEFRVNSYTTEWQSSASVALDRKGDFVVAWASYGQDGDGRGIFAQRFDATGEPRGGEFQVNTYTTDWQLLPSVASDPAGNFVVVWAGVGQDGWGIFAQRFDANGLRRGDEFQVSTGPYAGVMAAVASDSAGNFVVAWEDWITHSAISAQRFGSTGARRGGEFEVNSYTTGRRGWPSVALDAIGNFVVAWESDGQDRSGYGVFGQRFDATGARRGGEFQVNTYTTDRQWAPSVTSDSAGDFVVAWESWGPYRSSTFAQRFDATGARRGGEFQVNTYTTQTAERPSVASDAAGNCVVTWMGNSPTVPEWGTFARRFGGLQPAALAVDLAALVEADGNGVVEVGESVRVAPSWTNVNGQTLSFDGGLLSFTGPSGSGVSYSVQQAIARYGAVPEGATAACADCFQVGVDLAGPRPATHWDATLTERISPDALGQTKPWWLHVGESFADVPKTNPFYRFVETLLHRGVTGGCGAASYCPASPVTREQVAVFTLVGKEHAGYLPAPCTTPVFGDVPASSPFCRFVEELARRGVVSGCGNGNYCPADPVTREQMPIFVLRVLEPTLSPPACGTPMFGDVPATSPFCAWIEELARRGVVSGCGSGNYCPADPVAREQLAVFVAATFGLSLYGP